MQAVEAPATRVMRGWQRRALVRYLTAKPRDFLLVATPGAGKTAFALRVAAERDVLLVTKGVLGGGSTAWAQGGIAAAVGPGDTVEAHAADTLAAGAGLSDAVAARIVCADAPATVADLAALGVRFDRSRGDLALAREGAHSLPRVVHAGGDATGRHVAEALAARVRGHDRITVLEGTRVDDLITTDAGVTGVMVTGGQVVPADGVVLATGGAGHLFSRTTNPPGATRRSSFA